MGGTALSPLRVQYRGDDKWMLLDELRFYHGDGKIKVPAGFVSDLDSIPRIPYLHSFLKGRAVRSAVIHDWLYRRQVGRKRADRVMRDAMRVEGVAPIYRWLIYAGMRVFGWYGYWRAGRRSDPVTMETTR